MSKKASKNEGAPQVGDRKFSSLADLTPDPSNARKHNPRNVGMLVDSLHQVGAARSIVVDENGVVLAGNATIEAAAEAGIHRVKTVEADGSEIVAVVRRGLSKEQKTKLALYDNRVAELAEWNPDILSELDTKVLEGMFSDEEIARILCELPGGDQWGDMGLPNGDKSPFEQMTFTLANEQAEQVKTALEKAKGLGPFVDTGNENSNGNALSRVCETYLNG